MVGSRPEQDGIEREFVVSGFKTSTVRVCHHSRMDIIVQIQQPVSLASFFEFDIEYRCIPVF